MKAPNGHRKWVAASGSWGHPQLLARKNRSELPIAAGRVFSGAGFHSGYGACQPFALLCVHKHSPFSVGCEFRKTALLWPCCHEVVGGTASHRLVLRESGLARVYVLDTVCAKKNLMAQNINSYYKS